MDTLIQIGDFFVQLWESLSWFVTDSINDLVTFANYIKTGSDSLLSVVSLLPSALSVICVSSLSVIVVLRLVGRD